MTPHVPARVAFLGMTLSLSAGAALAQQDSLPQLESYWIQAGLGVGSEDFAGHAGLGYQHGVPLFSLRVAGTAGEDRKTVIGLPIEGRREILRIAQPLGGGQKMGRARGLHPLR